MRNIYQFTYPTLSFLFPFKQANVLVRVEHRTTKSDTYGKGEATKLDMLFGDVLERVAGGDSSLYMTTQDVRPGPDGHPEVMAPPTSNLASDFPLQPSVLGNLVPQQVNIWMGSAPEGSTSGLHLDFHDNLYVLLYGKKRFRLYPPSSLAQMYVNGKVKAIHPNGRVVFESQGDVLPDGSDAHEVDAWRKKRNAEKELEAAEIALSRGEKGAKARLAAAERALDAVLDAALDDDAFGGFDDFEALEMNEAGVDVQRAMPAMAGEPDSFSQVDLSLPLAKLRAKFPDFPGVKAALEVDMEAGQSLYLPAGWFHEVTSFSSDDHEAGEPGFHLALNYWTHPPDHIDPSLAGFEQPYLSEYWGELWETRKSRYNAQTFTKEVSKNMQHSQAMNGEQDKGKRKREEDDFEVESDEESEEETGDEEEELGAHGGHKRHSPGHHPKHSHHEHEHGHSCGCGHDHHHHHHHHHHHEGGSDADYSEWRAPTHGERAHFLLGVRGMFGCGRRQHLYRFIGLRLRGRT